MFPSEKNWMTSVPWRNLTWQRSMKLEHDTWSAMADGPPEWLRSRVRILRKKSSPRSAPLTPYRLELVFGGFQLDHFDEDRLDLLLRWLRASKGLVQQGLVAVNGNSLGSSLSLLCWADFRGSNLQDTGLEKLLKSLAVLPLNMERLYLAQNSITSRLEFCGSIWIIIKGCLIFLNRHKDVPGSLLVAHRIVCW